jgi:hypothetical protein
LIPSTMSTSPDIGQLGPADHLYTGVRESWQDVEKSYDLPSWPYTTTCWHCSEISDEKTGTVTLLGTDTDTASAYQVS